jgi:WD40 repeat protein
LSVLGDGVTIASLAFPPDGKGRQQLRLWDTSRGSRKTLRKITSFQDSEDALVCRIDAPKDDSEEEDDLSSLAVLSDGVTIASIGGGYKGIHLWQLDLTQRYSI